MRSPSPSPLATTLFTTALTSLSPTSGGSADGGPLAAPSPSPSSSPSNDTGFHFYVAYACLYALGGWYLLPSAISWVRMSRNIYTEDKTAVRLFALLGGGSFLRALAFLLVALWMVLVLKSTGSAKDAQHLHLSYVQLVTTWQVLGMLGSLVLVSVFLLVFNTWAHLIEQTRPGAAHGGGAMASSSATNTATAPPPRVLFIRMVLATNVAQIVTFSMVKLAPTDFVQSCHLFATILLTCCFGVCIFLLPVYGKYMCTLLGKVAEGASKRQRNIRKIAAISAVFCIMRTLSELLLACSEYSQLYDGEDDGSSSNTTATNSTTADGFQLHLHIPAKRIMEANPIFFFSPDGSSTTADDNSGLLRWVVLLEVVAFPIEWTLLMTLLCVLPSRAVLPSIRGYQTIPDDKRRY